MNSSMGRRGLILIARSRNLKTPFINRLLKLPVRNDDIGPFDIPYIIPHNDYFAKMIFDYHYQNKITINVDGSGRALDNN